MASKEYNHAYWLANKEKLSARNTEWCRANKDKIKAKNHRSWVKHSVKIAERSRQWRVANADYYRRTNRIRYVRKTYGLSKDNYEQLLKRQNFCCAICTEPFKTDAGGHCVYVHVDHCHSTGDVRGLLCRLCNTAVGLLRDSSGIAIAAAAYLSKNQAVRFTQ